MSSKNKYFLVYKPFGMLSQFSKSNPNESTLQDLEFDFPKDVYPVGRLDKDSEGLLILTNNNYFKLQHTDPKFEKAKKYWVQVEGIPEERDLHRFETGDIRIKVKSGIYNCKPSKIRLLSQNEFELIPPRNPPIRFRKNIPTTWIEIELKEGKNRQIRKMTAQINCPTLRLIRIASDEYSLTNMMPGEVREI
ncbi:MAG: pseudouridine synthase [Crocinitomicaceae bacterium]|nr:pseudouridine synthase [Crocinitomicaceae bacterium]